MWNPVEIEMHNLFSHKESKYTFLNNQCVVIWGKNITDRGFENNGAGKTTLIEAITLALTNETLRSVKKETFINREEEDCKIVFTLQNNFLKKKMRIVRQFFRGNKAVHVEIWENDKLNKQIVSVNEANKYILEQIGISREDLLRYYIISQDNRYTFFTATDVEKKEIMNRITSADMINPIMDQLTSMNAEKAKIYEEITSQIDNLSIREEVLKEQKISAEQNSNEELLQRIEEDITKQEEELKALKISLEKEEKLRKDNEKLLSKLEVQDCTSLVEQKRKLSKKNDDLSDKMSDNKKIQRKLLNEIDGHAVCPKCKHTFLLESEFDLTYVEAKKMLKEVEKQNIDLDKKINENQNKIDDIKEDICKAEENNEKYNVLKRKINHLTDNIEDYESRIKRCEDKIKRYKNEKKEAKEKKNTDLIKSLQKQIDDCKKQKEEITLSSQPLLDEIDLIKFWIFNMGKSGFMTYLANKSVKIIEGMTNSFLKKFGVDVIVKINGFKILKNGDVREKIDVFVSNDGLNVETFMSKSGGERGRVSLAGVLAIQKLINMSLDGRGLNLLCFDESFAGMDSLGQENIIKIFEKMNMNIFVITQNVDENFNVENPLYVIKENGISRYV